MRIIKGDTSNTWIVPSRVRHGEKCGARIIEKESFKAKEFAEKIKKEALGELRRREETARLHAQEIQEATARRTKWDHLDRQAENVIENFFLLERYASVAKEQIQVIALAVVNKILGGPLQMSGEHQSEILSGCLDNRSTHNKLSIDCPIGRKFMFDFLTCGELFKLPISVKESPEIPAGFLRLATVFGEIQCRESAALSTLKKIIYEQ